MTKFLTGALIAFISETALSYHLISVSLSALSVLPPLEENQLIYACTKDQLYSEQEWNKKPFAHHLLPKNYKKKEELRFFEARAAFLVPAKTFNPSQLHNIDFVKKLDPPNLHVPTAPTTGTFAVRSTLYFPEHWKAGVLGAKAVGRLKPENTPYLEVTNEFSWYDQAKIEGDVKILMEIQSLKLTDAKPLAINRQEIININQMIEYGFIETLFFPHPKGTLVYVVYVVGIEKDVLEMGEEYGVSVEDAVLGKYPSPLNSERGIGSGLPNYTAEITLNLAKAMAGLGGN